MSDDLLTKARLIGGICVGLSIFVTAYTVTLHLVYTRHLALKAYTIRILLLPSFYAAEALFALLFPNLSVVLAVLRSCYEAFALFSFVQLMLAYLSLHCPSQGDGAKGAIFIALDLEKDQQVSHVPPLCCLKDWPMGPIFLRRTLVGVFQYSAIMPFVTVLTGIQLRLTLPSN